jgi:hypothetical protein
MGACDCSAKTIVKPKTFFGISPTIQNQVNSAQTANNKVKLEFSIEECDIDKKYQVMAEFLNSNIQPFCTETVRSNQNLIIFNSCYLCEYFFQQPQMMRFSIIKNGKNIGSLTPYLGMIIGSQNST